VTGEAANEVSRSGLYDVEFTGGLAGTQLPLIVADGSLLRGAAQRISVATVQDGVGTWSLATVPAESCLQPPPPLAEDSNDHTVSCQLTGLEANTAYQVRLVGENTETKLKTYSTPDLFTTLPPPPPAISNIEVPQSGITTSSAHVAATIDPQGARTEWRLLRSPQPDASQAECEALPPSEFTEVTQGTIPTGEPGSVSIGPDVTGLRYGETNCLRLIATNAGGEDQADRVFRTLTDHPPTELETASTAPRTDTTARINARLNPEGDATFTYRFELSEDGTSWESLPTQTSNVNGRYRVVVGEQLSGLKPQTTYHYRLAGAENEAGAAAGSGAEMTFTTRAATPNPGCPNEGVRREQHADAYLADCRGIELVNNPDKGVQNVDLETGTILVNRQITPNGERALWDVTGGAPGAPDSTANVFLARRTAGGWESQAVLPPAQEQYGGGLFESNLRNVSPDLAHFVSVFSNSPERALVRLDDEQHSQLLQLFPNDPKATLVDYAPELSDDGAHVVAINGETGQLEDLGGGAPEVLSLMPNGEQASCALTEGMSFRGKEGVHLGTGLNFEPGYRTMSSDASRVYFQARANGECAASAPSGLYERDREANGGAGQTMLIDPGRPGAQPPSEPHLIRVSPDGSEAFFTTASRLDPADTNEHEDVYRWDEAEGRSSCLTCRMENEAGETITDPHLQQIFGQDTFPFSVRVLLSDDLSHVYFQSKAGLSPAATAGHSSIYVLSGGRLRFVADVGDGTPLQREPELSADGEVLLFSAAPAPSLSADLVAKGASGELYRYDARDESLECVSCARDGITSYTGLAAHMSADGSTVAFVTEQALLSRDINNGKDVYEWRGGRLGLISDGATRFPAVGASEPTVRAVDANGSNVFFTLPEPGLTGYEHDGFSNLYDARIGGGFPRPLPEEACDVLSDKCQDPLQQAPFTTLPGSALILGSGNVSAPSKPVVKPKAKPKPKMCKKGRVRKRVHGKLMCVKRPKARRGARRHK
jgi:hypothetical protein